MFKMRWEIMITTLLLSVNQSILFFNMNLSNKQLLERPQRGGTVKR